MKRIFIFCGIAYGLTYLIAFGLMTTGGAMNPLYGSGLMACMLTPAIAHVLTRLITKEGFKDCYLKFNLNKQTVKYYLLSWLGLFGLTCLGVVLYFLIFPGNLDPSLTLLGTYLENNALGTPTNTAYLWGVLVGQIISALTFAIILNAPFMFGEEFGWRAYLLPKLVEEKGMKKALLYSGVIWGLWHAPIIAMGHNYGLSYPLFPYLGIIAMVIFCIVIGIFMSFITLRTHSVWPAVIAHGVMNGTASFSIFLHTQDTPANPFIGPMPVGLIGGLFFIITAFILYRKLIKA